MLKDGCDNGGGNQAVRGWYRLHIVTPSPSFYQSAWPWFDSSPPDPFPQLQSTLKKQQTAAEPKYVVCTARGQLFVMTSAVYLTLWHRKLEYRINDAKIVGVLKKRCTLILLCTSVKCSLVTNTVVPQETYEPYYIIISSNDFDTWLFCTHHQCNHFSDSLSSPSTQEDTSRPLLLLTVTDIFIRLPASFLSPLLVLSSAVFPHGCVAVRWDFTAFWLKLTPWQASRWEKSALVILRQKAQ